jgi:hypothetical protein
VCSSPGVLAVVGWVLFHTSTVSICSVISTSGAAEARASAYQQPMNR